MYHCSRRWKAAKLVCLVIKWAIVQSLLLNSQFWLSGRNLTVEIFNFLGVDGGVTQHA
jgi:hypothetical protein